MRAVAFALVASSVSVGMSAQQTTTPSYTVLSFSWAHDARPGRVRLSPGLFPATYVVHVVIPVKSRSGEPVRMPKQESIRVWLLTGDGGNLELASKPKDGTAPAQVEEYGEPWAVFGPFHFKAGPQPTAIGLKIEGNCYLVTVFRSDGPGPTPSILPMEWPKPCSN